uniref:Uncharacterized protein n=1 Tax=Tetradesmus obliquus TaxID=3088 RepID=A0A383WJ27_TETOB
MVTTRRSKISQNQPEEACQVLHFKRCRQHCSTHSSAVMKRRCVACFRPAEVGGQHYSSAQQGTCTSA